MEKNNHIIIALFFLIIVAYVDLITGYEISFSLFYLPPVALIAWNGSRKFGIGMSFLAATIWYMVDFLSEHNYSNFIIPIWNAAVRFSFFMIVSLMIYDRRNSEKQSKTAALAIERAYSEKSEFVLNVNYKIGLYLNDIIGMNHILVQSNLTPQKQKYAISCQSAAQSLLIFLRDILVFLKIGDGQLRIKPTPFNMNEILAQCADISSYSAEAKGLHLIISLAPDTRVNLVGDTVYLSHIINNLLSNAIKFTTKGRVVLAVKTDPKEQPSGMAKILFSVEDTGVGIKPELAEQLFSPADHTNTSSINYDQGIGLTVCKYLTETMGGKISVQSTYGLGTVFRVSIPFAIDVETRSVENRLPYAVRRVLVVDEHAATRQFFCHILRSFSMQAEEADSAEDALRKFRTANVLNQGDNGEPPFDLILMAWHIREMNGIETTRHIRVASTTHKQPLVIMVTAFDRAEIREQAQLVGVNGFLVKPVQPSVLLKKIRFVSNAINAGSWKK